jgi:hypothetical protein
MVEEAGATWNAASCPHTHYRPSIGCLVLNEKSKIFKLVPLDQVDICHVIPISIQCMVLKLERTSYALQFRLEDDIREITITRVKMNAVIVK